MSRTKQQVIRGQVTPINRPQLDTPASKLIGGHTSIWS